MNIAIRIAILLITLSCNILAQSDLLFVLDASGSMAKRNNGETQIDTARKSLKSALTEIPADINVGLRVYAHRVPQNNKEESCKDSELLIPISNDGRTRIPQAIDQISVKGYTPIAYSLLQSKNDFDITRESEKTIILLSDGEETCGGDPVATVKQLLAEGFKVKIHSIGFMVDANTAAQLKAIAEATGGKYFDAKSSDELTKVFKEATKQVKFAEIKDNKYGQKTIKGGANFEEAQNLEPDTEYKLEHVLKKNQFDYFAVDLKAGQEIKAELRTYEKGIAIRTDGKTAETTMPYAGIKLINSDKSKEKKEAIIGGAFQTKTVSMTADKEGLHYLLIGSEYEPINPDYTTFKYSIITKGDLDAEKDAPSTTEGALAVEFKKYTKNNLTEGDLADTYVVNLKAGESFFVGYMPNGASNTVNFIELKIFGEYREQLFTKTFPAGQGGKSDTIKAESDSVYYVEVSRQNGYESEKPLEYTIDFKKIS
jgi:hypothetical protein